MSLEQITEDEKQIVSRVPIRVAQLGDLNAYIISEHELDSLAKLDELLIKDPPDSVFLNFALFLFPISLSFFTALLTTTIYANRTYELYVIITLLTLLSSLIMFSLWLRDRRSYHKVRLELLASRAQEIQKIRNRMPPNPPVQAVHLVSEE